jgi:hypothetical protein
VSVSVCVNLWLILEKPSQDAINLIIVLKHPESGVGRSAYEFQAQFEGHVLPVFQENVGVVEKIFIREVIVPSKAQFHVLIQNTFRDRSVYCVGNLVEEEDSVIVVQDDGL